MWIILNTINFSSDMNFTKYGKQVDSKQLILDNMTMQKKKSLTTKKLDIKKKH